MHNYDKWTVAVLLANMMWYSRIPLGEIFVNSICALRSLGVNVILMWNYAGLDQ